LAHPFPYEKKITVNGEIFYQNKFNGDPFISWIPNARRTARAKPHMEITFAKHNAIHGYQLKLSGRK
jgi:hypothetical protein